MDTVVSNGSQPIVIGDKEGFRGCHEELIACGQMQDAVREHNLFADAARERFGLRQLEDLSSIKREIAEIKADLSLKVVEEANRTRDMLLQHEIARMRSDEGTLRNQLIAAGIVPAA